jgi:hypothetical protein
MATMDPASREMSVVVVACLGVALALSGCTWVGRQSSEVARLRGGLEPAPKEAREGAAREIFKTAGGPDVLPDECSRSEAEEWGAQADAIPGAGLKAAACFLVLAREGKEQRARLADAQKGRALVEKVLKSDGQNGFAHYVLAFLTGLVAENNSAQGLRLVPVIEREALEAANLDPGVDHGGPDRLLGELYLRAPSFPMSVGDSSKAIYHFRRALGLAPGDLANRLGLVEALLAEGEGQEACGELKQAFKDIGARNESSVDLGKALTLMDSLCLKMK